MLLVTAQAACLELEREGRAIIATNTTKQMLLSSCAESQSCPFCLGPEQSLCTFTRQCQSVELRITDTTFSSLRPAPPSPPSAKTQMQFAHCSSSLRFSTCHRAALTLERIMNTRCTGESDFRCRLFPPLIDKLVEICQCSACLLVGFKRTFYVLFLLPFTDSLYQLQLWSPSNKMHLTCLPLLRQPHGNKLMPIH